MSKQSTMVLIPTEQAKRLEEAGDYALDFEIDRILVPFGSDGNNPQYDYYQIGTEESDLSLDADVVWPASAPPDEMEFEALITPDGVWHEIDWYIDDAWEVWLKRARELLAQHSDCTAFTVYMHV